MANRTERKTYKLESDLCSDFRAWLKAKSPEWTVYAETGGWDMLCVNASGLQVGIQAKLKANCCVLRQALENVKYYGKGGSMLPAVAGPHYRAVLVPSSDDDFLKLARMFGVVVLETLIERRWHSGGGEELHFRAKWHLNPFDRDDAYLRQQSGNYLWPTKAPEAVPKYIPDVVAGVKSPRQLTPWKIAMLKAIATIEVRGHITTSQAKALGIHASRLSQMAGSIKGRCELIRTAKGTYKLGPAMKHHTNHPEVYPQILREIRESISGKAT